MLINWRAPVTGTFFFVNFCAGCREDGDLSRANRVVLLTSVIDPGHGDDQGPGERGGWWGEGGEDHQHNEYLGFTKSIRRSGGSTLWLVEREEEGKKEVEKKKKEREESKESSDGGGGV